MPMPSVADLVAQSGKSAPAFFDKNSEVGDTITGVVIDVDTRQTRDPKDNKLQTWEDGSPRLQIVITLATELADDKDDNGERTVYVKWWTHQRKALLAALEEAGLEDIPLGAEFTATLVGTEKAKSRAMNDTKIYAYTVKSQ